MKLAVVLPTKNEEKDIMYLVNSIKAQTFKDLVIIVADNHSTDKTRNLVKKAGCIVIDGGTLSTGRNKGMEKAIELGAELVVFIDADVILPKKTFLEELIKEFYGRNLDYAGTLPEGYDLKTKIDVNDPIGTVKPNPDWKYRGFYGAASRTIKKYQNSKKRPMMQQFIFVKPEIYKKIGGFQEFEYREDVEYCRYVKKHGYKFGVLSKAGKFLVSPRRIEESGFWKMTFVYLILTILCELGYKFRHGGRLNYYTLHYDFRRKKKRLK